MDLKVGEHLKEGEQFATLGNASINLDYPRVCPKQDL